MKIDYTLPALQPGTFTDLTPATLETGPSFREQLTGVQVQIPVGWEQQLRLDVRPFTATYLAPPRRPNNFELNDPQDQRVRWRTLLWRHSAVSQTPAQSDAAKGGQAIQTMLDMLLQMQHMEDSITTQSVAISRG
jgi:hypothetical protein